MGLLAALGGLACTAPVAEAPATAALPATATSTTTLAPWPARLGALAGRPIPLGPATPLRQHLSKEKPTIVAFWASYCPPCLAEMPMLERLHKEGHAVLGVSLDADQPDTVQRLLKERGAHYPNIMLDIVSMKAAGSALPGGLPFTLVASPKGQGLVALFGKTDRATLLQALRHARSALEDRPQPGL